MVLKDMRDIFKSHQKTNADFGLREPEQLKVNYNQLRVKIKLRKEEEIDWNQYEADAAGMLTNIMDNHDQYEIYKVIWEAVENRAVVPQII